MSRRIFGMVSILPADVDLLISVKAPNRNPRVGGANHGSHPLGLCVQITMAQNAAHKNGGFRLPDIQVNQTVPGMTQVALIEIAVEGKQSRPTQGEQEGNDFFVCIPFHPAS